MTCWLEITIQTGAMLHCLHVRVMYNQQQLQSIHSTMR
jgi:hypothetical protein